MKKLSMLALVASTSLFMAACSGSGESTQTEPGASAPAESSPSNDSGSTVIDLDITTTTGPNGETPTSVTDLTLTDEEVAAVQEGNYKVALLWHTTSAFVTAVQAGAEAEFERLGIEVVAVTDAQFDAAKQADQIQTALVKAPDVIVSLPVDTTTAASAFQPAVDDGVELIFLSNVPDGYKQGDQYASMVTDDLFKMGELAAHALGDALGGEGEIGVVFNDAEYYVTNQRDAAFKQTMENEYPDIKIVAQQGFTDPNTAEGIASAMLTQNPDLAGIYTSWAEPAQGVLAALRTADNTTTKVVTLDLDDTVAVDMANGGQTVAIVADKAWELGAGIADAAAYALLDKEAPAFAVAGALTVTKDNLEEGYQESLHSDLPKGVAAALK